MPIRLSLFTSELGWWNHTVYEDETVMDTMPIDSSFRSGRATLLSQDGVLVSGLARGGRRGKASDFLSNTTFERISAIEPVPLQQLLAAVRTRAKRSAAAVAEESFGLFSESASEDIRSWISTARPDVGVLLDELVADEPGWIVTNPEVGGQLRMERDAVNLALEIAGLDRDAALEGIALPGDPQHFSLVPLVEVNEDSIVIDDLDIYPGWERVSDLRPAGRVYRAPGSGRRLTILHANKNRIEETTGVDLVYFIHEYQSVVLVQYKRVVSRNNRLVVRLDEQLSTELTRMEQLESNFPSSAASTGDLDEQRLAAGFCFFKLCDTMQPVEVADLSRGKYLDLATWRTMRSLGLMTGPKGGRRLLYEAVTRYLSNSTFAELAGEGWLGSAPGHLEALIDYMFARYEAGKTVMWASLELGVNRRRFRPSYLETMVVTAD